MIADNKVYAGLRKIRGLQSQKILGRLMMRRKNSTLKLILFLKENITMLVPGQMNRM